MARAAVCLKCNGDANDSPGERASFSQASLTSTVGVSDCEASRRRTSWASRRSSSVSGLEQFIHRKARDSAGWSGREAAGFFFHGNFRRHDSFWPATAQIGGRDRGGTDASSGPGSLLRPTRAMAMSKRGRILRDPSFGPGLVLVDGRQYPFPLERVWKFEVLPGPAWS